MKCIKCGTDSKYSERRDGKCSRCGAAFAFEPQKGDWFTDRAFQAAINAVSANSRLRWGVEHLYYEICRRARKRHLAGAKWLVLGLGLLVISAIVSAITSRPIWIAGVAVGVVSLALFLYHLCAPTVRINQGKFEVLYAKWIKAHGRPKGVIVRQPAPPVIRAKEPDLGDYSFDRAVICDRARTVDLLLANNFHFENNCAVLSSEGYPPGPFEMVRAMLKRNPRLEVFALHDATREGCRLAYRLANDPAWFKDQARVTDVGLRPGQARPFRGLLLRAPARVLAGEGVTAQEAAWLSRHLLELAVIRPEQVLKRLFRVINRKIERKRESGSDGDGGVSFEWDSFNSDAGDADGGGDGFG